MNTAWTSACLALLLGLCGPLWALEPQKLLESAREQVGVTLSYDPNYRRLAYPGGDVPLATGVCTDVLIRALRAQGLDLQAAVHQDMREHFALYPKNWGLKRPDRNIDHRRVANLMTYFRRQGWALPPEQTANGYRPGDILAWDLGGGMLHIGILSDRQGIGGTPLVLHNIGRGTQEEDSLGRFRQIGHYRLPRG